MKKSANITLSLVTIAAAALTWSCSDHRGGPAAPAGQTTGTTTTSGRHMFIPVHGGAGASGASGATAGGSSSKGSVSRGGFGSSSSHVSA